MAKKIGQKTKTPMPCLDPHERRHQFAEVTTGFTPEMAIQEADRCIQCKNQPCIAGCPVEIDIPKFVQAVAEGNFEEAFHTIGDRNILPAICGRVCPQEEQCEKLCTLSKKFESVAIGRLERFVADFGALHGLTDRNARPASTGHKVAVVGSGPAGLTVAADLAKLGHDVTIFEALHKAGGVLIYGIPEFRLPKEIVEREIRGLKALGVDIKTNHVIGRTFTVDDLLGEQGFQAVFIATGAGLPHFPKIPGTNLIGVYSANEYLTRSNLMKAYKFPETDTPAHPGETRGGRRRRREHGDGLRADGAASRCRARLPRLPPFPGGDAGRAEEVEHAEEEGVEFLMLMAPTAIVGDERLRVTAMRCVRMELGEPDASRAPEPGSDPGLGVRPAG